MYHPFTIIAPDNKRVSPLPFLSASIYENKTLKGGKMFLVKKPISGSPGSKVSELKVREFTQIFLPVHLNVIDPGSWWARP